MITKVDYVEFCKCGKHLYIKKNKPEVEEEPSDFDKALMQEGLKTGEIARGCFGHYKLVDRLHYDPETCATITKTLMDGKTNAIAEASFLVDDLFCANDILLRSEDGGYDIYEVKSSTDFDPSYTYDASYQYYVLTKAGVKVNHVYVMYLNKDYVFQDKIELGKLFTRKEVEMTPELVKQVEYNLDLMRHVSKEPETVANKLCRGCSCFGYCFKNLPKNNIYTLSGYRFAPDRYNEGIRSFQDILDNNVKINDKQKQQIEVELAGNDKIIVNQDALNTYLAEMKYPLYFLDFETIDDAIPCVNGYHPHQPRIFQYSLHIQKDKDDKDLVHKEYLQERLYDNTEEIINRLVEDLGESGSIVVYSSFEKTQLSKLAIIRPDRAAEINAIIDRLFDLEKVFSERKVYQRKLAGKSSIKKVLPTFCKEFETAYHDLPGAHNGTEAMSEYRRLLATTGAEHDEIRDGLLQYCGLDTLAEYEVLEEVKKIQKTYQQTVQKKI